MKIAQVLRPEDGVPPCGYGGIGRVVEPLIKGLAKKGHEITLFVAKNSKITPNLKNIKIVQLLKKEEIKEFDDLKINYWASYISGVFKWIKKEGNFDIIHNHYDPIALILGEALELPMLTTIHGTANEQNLALFGNLPKNPYSAISFSQRRTFPKEMNFVGVVYNAIDAQEFPFSEVKKDFLLSVSRIMPVKGQHIAIQVAKEVGLELIIAGNVKEKRFQGYFEREIKPHIDLDLTSSDKAKKDFLGEIETNKYKSKKRIVHLGEVNSKERNILMKYAKCFLFPISWEEPYGLVMAEANVVGTPVIAFNRGSVLEVVQHGITGYITSTVEEMIESIKKIDQISPQACRRHIEEKFSPEKMTEGYLNLYEKILKKIK